MRKYFKIIAFIKFYKGYAFLNIIFNVLTVIFNLLSLLVFVPFLSLLFDRVDLVTQKPVFSWSVSYLGDWFNFQLSSYIVENGKMEALFFICVSVAVLFFLKNLTRYMAMYYLAVIRNSVVRDIRKQLYNHLLNLPLAYYSEERKGDIIARVTNDVTMIEVSIMSTLEMIFREPLSIILSLVVLLYWSPNLTSISLILLPISALIIARIGKSLKRTSAKAQKKMGDLISHVEESISGLRIIKAFNAEKKSSQGFDRENNEYNIISIRAFRKRDLASPLSEFLGSLVMVLLVWFGGKLILTSGNEAQMTGEEFMGFIIVFSQLLRPIQGLSNAYSNIQKGVASVDRVNEVLFTKNNITEITDAISKDVFTNQITYENVTFSYRDEDVLKNINVTIKKGETVALVGQSGSGKSTFVDLLPRFYDVDSGQIYIDNVPIKNLKINNLRSLFGMVTQESILFNDTVYNNIAFGKKNASKEDVFSAARIANAEDFINELPDKFNSNIGDSGGKLSGGQRQRISIARAILNDPPILIMDEATSALDTESERLVQDAIENLMKNRTAIVIAHRLSTIRNANEILVIHKGEIVERGTHNELIKLGGTYKKLCDLQMFA